MATELARGPWSATLAHGGPPAALLGRALEAIAGPGLLARLTFELVRPVPLGRLALETSIVRDGKTAGLLEATLLEASTEKPLVRVRALRLRERPVSLPPAPPGGPQPELAPALPAPSACQPFVFPFFRETVGYHTAMEMRLARGRYAQGAMAAWMRARVPLLDGESLSPLQRVLLAADSGNGVSLRLEPEAWTFVNPDLTVHLHRLPEGEWVGLDSRTAVEAKGVGLAESRLLDEGGSIGRALQSLIVEPR